MSGMGRREFVALLGGAAAWPIAARGQQAALPVIAFINGGAADTAARYLAAFRKGLREAGYVEAQNVTVEYHWLGGRYEGVPALMADLVRRQVALIATPGSNVASLARPGGNATGVNFSAYEVAAKQLGLLQEFVPKAARVAVLINPSTATSAETTLQAVQEAARVLRLEVQVLKAASPAEIDDMFAALARERADALFIQGDGFYSSRRIQLATLAMRERMPASNVSREMAEAGLLMSHGTNIADMFRQVGVYSGSILKGAKPADLPVMQSTKFEFVINLQTARVLGLEVPPTLLARADEVIE